jgi:hypothetical protein
MPASLDQATQMEALSDLLLRRHEAALWREVFLGSTPRPVCFEEATLTLVCTDAPCHSWRQAELAKLAARFGGWCESVGARSALLCFSQPQLAVRAALLLQKIGADLQVRSAVLAGKCKVAGIDVDGELRHFVLASQEGLAEAALQRVAPGVVEIAPETYEKLDALLAEETGGALVMTEFDDTEAATQTSITLVPTRSAAMSTFAGLGGC